MPDGATRPGRARRRKVCRQGVISYLADWQDATFVGGGGLLALTYSRFYAGIISGFATTGADALDLTDIDFTGATEATFNGTASGGVLTVTDGTRAAHIHLHGDYTGVAFMTAADGQGGIMVTDTTARPRTDAQDRKSVV